MDLAAIYFGMFLGVFVFTFAKVVQQTHSIWGRTNSFANPYLYMIWTETVVNLIFALITFLYLNGIIPGSLVFFLVTVAVWAIQTQLLPQIIANRVSLIMTSKRRASQLKWGLVIAIGCINIAVCYIWTVAQMPSATPYQIMVNHMFEKAEKSFFLIIDLALNLYFLYLVRFRLIADGLTKYWRLFKFNVGIVVVSSSMDILLLGFLSLPDPYLYVQFAPLAYIVKLYMELLMAVLISKVVRSGATGAGNGRYGSSAHKSNPTHLGTFNTVVGGSANVPKSGNTFVGKLGRGMRDRRSSSGSEINLTTYSGQHGITKTIETTVIVGDGDDNHSSGSR